MAKRLYELAKDYGVSAKEVIKILNDNSYNTEKKPNNFTGVDDRMKAIVDKALGKSKQDKPKSTTKQGGQTMAVKKEGQNQQTHSGKGGEGRQNQAKSGAGRKDNTNRRDNKGGSRAMLSSRVPAAMASRPNSIP